jgi:energy-coupling factor transporter ATP-binding protein EcfA2
MIKDLALAGYRSFGAKPQYFEDFSKINVFIGRNNSGKSNVLRFLTAVYPHLAHHKAYTFDALDSHMPGYPPFQVGIPYRFEMLHGVPSVVDGELLRPIFRKEEKFQNGLRVLAKLFQEKANFDGTAGAAWAFVDHGSLFLTDGWPEAFKKIEDSDVRSLWIAVTNYASGGVRDQWIADILSALRPRFPAIKSQLIPAIREIGQKNSAMEGYGGSGIIERLSMLESPGVLKQSEREKFNEINRFLVNVTENNSARITVPYERDTILVHMDGKVLPLESLGSGLHEVIILAVAATLLEDHVICMEEPELHLNPVLQKKLIRYLHGATKNQYFISTHSASFIDAPEAAVFHITQEDLASKVAKVSSNHQRSSICEDLGYHPSDLLQTNCIIWVEGPSDRLYLNWWISSFNNELIEGVHYSIMFYGGRLLSHLSNEDDDQLIDDFISLRRLNRRGAIVMDSDRSRSTDRINETKRRLRDEFENGTGFAWITSGREVENYVDPELIKEAISHVHKSAVSITKLEKFDNTLLVKRPRAGNGQVSKIEIAKYVVQRPPQLDRFDLQEQIGRLIKFIESSNPRK